MKRYGTNNYIFKGRFTGAQLQTPGLNVNLAENTSKGKAFYIQEDNSASMQVLYADEKIFSFTQTVGTTNLTVNVTGTANTTGKVIVMEYVKI